jgi:hypothetical protein
LTLTICSAGVDSLYVSFAGTLDAGLLGRLEELRLQAQAEGAPVSIHAGEQRRLVVHPNGSGYYRYWLQCSDFQVLVAQGGKLPPVYLKLSSAYIHQLGPIAALREAETFVRGTLPGQLGASQASRVDVYADFQGWIPDELDVRRFVTRARRSVQHFDAVRAYFDGQRFTGYQFGRDQLVARLYDKGREVVESGKEAWMHEVWGARVDPAAPVWRLEFQLRREAIATFNVRTAEEAIACREDFWRYCTTDWLTLRVPKADRQRDRWPVSPEWLELSRASIGLQENGLVRRWIREVQEGRLVAGATGYFTSLAAVHQIREMDAALELLEDRVVDHLDQRGLTFAQAVARKQSESV